MNRKISSELAIGIILILAIIIGGFIWIGNKKISQYSYQSMEIKQPIKKQSVVENKTDEAAYWQAYTNSQYGFEIKLPPYWEGYRADTRKLSDGGMSVGFDFPFTFNEKKTYYEDFIQIIIYPISVWPSVQLSDGSKPPKIAENSKYVYSYARATDSGDSELDMANKDIKQIISTFKLFDETADGLTSEDIKRLEGVPDRSLPEDQVILPNGQPLSDYAKSRGITP